MRNIIPRDVIFELISCGILFLEMESLGPLYESNQKVEFHVNQKIRRLTRKQHVGVVSYKQVQDELDDIQMYLI